LDLCIKPNGNIIARRVPASEDSSSEDEDEVLPFTLKEYDLRGKHGRKGKVVRKVKICDKPFTYGSICASDTHVFVSLAHEDGARVYVFQADTGAPLSNWPVAARDVTASDVLPCGDLVLAGTERVIRYSPVGVHVATQELLNITDMAVFAASAEVVVTTTDAVNVFDSNLEGLVRTWPAKLTKETSINPDAGDSTDEEEADDDAASASSERSGTSSPVSKSSAASVGSTVSTKSSRDGDAKTSSEDPFATIFCVCCDSKYVYVRMESDDVLLFK